MKFSRKTIVISIVVIVLLGLGCYFYYQKTRAQLYVNPQLHFQVEYPAGWHTGFENQNFDHVGYDLDLSFCPTSLLEAPNQCKSVRGTSPQNGYSLAPILVHVLTNSADTTGLSLTQPNTKVIQGRQYKYIFILNNTDYKNEYDEVIASFSEK